MADFNQVGQSMHRVTFCVVALITGGVTSTACRAAGEGELARQFLDAVGEKSGFCVHLGFRNTALTTALSQDGVFLVHGLSQRRETISAARAAIRAQGLAGAVSVEHSALQRLPYSENLVDLLVAEDLSQQLEDGPLLDEIVRVLRPGGTALLGERPVGRGGLNATRLRKRLARLGVKKVETSKRHGLTWLKFRKPRPAEMDQWTHARYDVSRNAVSRDKVGVPTGVRWLAGPKWPTGNRKASVLGVAVSEKRLVYVFEDEVLTKDGLKKQKHLVARDAYNGLLLWQRVTSNDSPAILVHVGDRVLNVLKKGDPLVALDARTGEVIRTYKHTKKTSEVIYHQGMLVVRVGNEIRCLDELTGEVKWKQNKTGGNLVASGDSVFFLTDAGGVDGQKVFEIGKLDLKTGTQKWRISTSTWPVMLPALELVLYQKDILVLAGAGSHAVSAEDGRHLWSYDYKLIGHGGNYAKVVYNQGLLWVHNAESKGADDKLSNAWEGLDPRTGQIKSRIAHQAITHRCSYDVATERFFVCGSMDFVDLETQAHTRFAAARNSCRTAGVVPANGQVYTFPHGCACYPLLRGFMGLASNPPRADPLSDASRFETGRALESPTGSSDKAGGWVTHRGDSQRSGSIKGRGPAQLKTIWKRKLVVPKDGLGASERDHRTGGRLTSSVVAQGTVFVASSDTHELFALDARTGQPKWNFVAGGRIDCPPTIFGRLCLLGSRDGWVYCLRVSDGTLVWRFRAAPSDERIVAYGQLESKWPVVGGVLVDGGLAYFVAGRHGAADDGVHVYAAQPRTGKIVWHSCPQDFASVPDLLIASAGTLQMSDWEFDAGTGKNQSSRAKSLRSARLGLLDDAWYKRPLAMRKNHQQWTHLGQDGQLLVFNKERVCGFRAASEVKGGNGEISGHAELYATPLEKNGSAWSRMLPIGTQVKGMVLASDTLFVAGRLDGYDAASQGVWALNVQDGKPRQQQKLPAPLVHECLTIDGGRVFVSMENGEVICLGKP